MDRAVTELTQAGAAITTIAEFDPTAPLAEGITVLEASAGTGKTHAVSSLVVAEVAHGRPLDELLVVTFTRKATGTLRERVWQRLVAAVDALAPGAAPPLTPTGAPDTLLNHLRQGDPTEVAERRVRLRRAVSDFDASTIATTHGFCQQVLASLGVAGDAEPDLELVEDVSDLVADAVDDLFVRRFHEGGELLFDRATAVRIAKLVVDRPDCAIAPVDQNDADRLRRNFALALRRRIEEQKRAGRLLTYDDLLSRLDRSLGPDERGEIVAARLRRRFSTAIVDEFQDTDSVQWRILHRAFGGAPNRLVLVGDPKQAIYGFRGGDVFAYLQATRDADQRRALDMSWRSDQPLLDALDALFAGAQFGDPEIRHRPVRARPGAEGPGIAGSAAGPPVLVRLASRDHDAVDTTRYGWAAKPSVRRFIADDVATVALELLRQGSTIGDQPVGPRDLAVLTRTHREAAAACASLRRVGIPAVLHGGASVFTTEAAQHWLDLLQALEQPSAALRVHTVALGPFIGWDAQRLATATEDDWEQVDDHLHDWAAAARRHTIAGLLRRIEASTALTARLLSTVDGERQLSDLRHLAELLHTRQSIQPGSLTALSGWLLDQMAEADDADPEGTRRRLESDADAVSVHTIHGAKGLEFPIVLLPSVWDVPHVGDDDLPVFHDEHGARAVGVGGAGEVHEWQAHRAALEREAEELRLLYVALTRARHRVVAWWATSFDADQSAFARLLFGTDPVTGAVARRLDDKPDEAAVAAALFGRAIPVEEAVGATEHRYAPPPREAAELAVATFDREFDEHWVRTSYSGLTRTAHEAGPHLSLEPVEVDEAATTDEPPVEPVSPEPAEEAPPLPLAEVPGGARVGTLVHDMLEHTDFAAADLAGALATAAAEAGADRVVDTRVPDLLTGLAAAIDTPLGPAWDDRRLRDLHRTDRLDELAFDLPLAGGDRPTRALVTMGAIAEVFAGLGPDDPLAGYHERLRDPLLDAEVRGFLSGSIDVVARIPVDSAVRHVVIDYKTNHLAPQGQPGTPWHYRPEALAQAMQDAHYPLQAALYSVALHRFLRWRVAGYDPAAHLGGVAYLFLRGMVGPETPRYEGQPCGVFAWTPPASFVTDLSDVLDRGVER